MGADPDDVLSAPEAAQYLELRHVAQIYQLADATGIGRRIGHQWVFTRGELDAYKAQRADLRERGWKLVRTAQLDLPPDPPVTDELLDINAAAAILGVSVKRVYQVAEAGRLGTRHGTRWLFTRAEVEAYRAGRKKAGRPRKRS